MTGGWAKVLTGPFARTGGGLTWGFFRPRKRILEPPSAFSQRSNFPLSKKTRIYAGSAIATERK